MENLDSITIIAKSAASATSCTCSTGPLLRKAWSAVLGGKCSIAHLTTQALSLVTPSLCNFSEGGIRQYPQPMVRMTTWRGSERCSRRYPLCVSRTTRTLSPSCLCSETSSRRELVVLELLHEDSLCHGAVMASDAAWGSGMAPSSGGVVSGLLLYSDKLSSCSGDVWAL